jgi:NodT family efflux transporter outer membrane factor (OMF) lipoprotein
MTRNLKIKASVCIAAFSMVFMTGCDIMRSEYQRTDAVSIKSSWSGDAEYSSVMRDPQGAWWRDFDDPVLSSLIEKGFDSASELKVAASALQIMALRADVTDLNLLPTPTARLGASEKWDHNGNKIKSSSASVGISYEIDLFGRLKAERDVSRFAYDASYEDYLSVKLSLSSQIAAAYWKLAYFNDALKSEEENIREYETLIKLAELRFKEGAISLYDLNRTKSQCLSSKSSAASDRSEITAAKNTLMLLLSVDDEKDLGFDLSAASLQGKKVPLVAAGIPADILENRPDLRSAENDLKSKLADYDVSTLSFFPQLTLTGTLGTGSNALLKFFEDPAFTLAGALTAPFFNYENLTLSRNISKATYEKSVYQFENTLRKAIFEVAELLQRLEDGQERIRNTEEAVELARINDSHYRLRYDSGKMSYGDFLDNRRALRAATLENLREIRTQLENTASLYKALGGAQK